MSQNTRFVASKIGTKSLLILVLKREEMQVIDVISHTEAKVPYSLIQKAVSIQPYIVELNDRTYQLALLPTSEFLEALHWAGVHVLETSESSRASSSVIRCETNQGPLHFDITCQDFTYFNYELAGKREHICWNELNVKRREEQLTFFSSVQENVQYREITPCAPVVFNMPDTTIAERLEEYFTGEGCFFRSVIFKNEMKQQLMEQEQQIVCHPEQIYEKPEQKNSIDRRFNELLTLLEHNDLEEKPKSECQGTFNTETLRKSKIRNEESALRLSKYLDKTDPWQQYHNISRDIEYYEEIETSSKQGTRKNKSADTEEGKSSFDMDWHLIATDNSESINETRSFQETNSFQETLSRVKTMNQLNQRTSSVELHKIEVIDQIATIMINYEEIYLDIQTIRRITMKHALPNDISGSEIDVSAQLNLLESAYSEGYKSICTICQMITLLFSFEQLDTLVGTSYRLAKINNVSCNLKGAKDALLLKLAEYMTKEPVEKDGILPQLHRALLSVFVLNMTEAYQDVRPVFEIRALEALAAVQFDARAYSSFASTLETAILACEKLAPLKIELLGNRDYFAERSKVLRIKLYKASADVFKEENKASQAFADAVYCRTLGGDLNLDKYNSKYCQIVAKSTFHPSQINFTQLMEEYSIPQHYMRETEEIQFDSVELPPPLTDASMLSENASGDDHSFKTGFRASTDQDLAYVLFDQTFYPAQYTVSRRDSCTELTLCEECSAFMVEFKIHQTPETVSDQHIVGLAENLSDISRVVQIGNAERVWIVAVDDRLDHLLTE